jgi:hypothetical protein
LAERVIMNRVGVDSEPRTEACRLCGGQATLSFTDTILNKHVSGFWRCARCGSLQTDTPHWLEESYASVHSATDTGMVARNLQMAQFVSLLLRMAGVGRDTLCLDWGGGNGLFCRLMRDQGYNFFNDDRYAEPFYCTGFTADRIGIARCDIITSFEVFEHLPNPKAELAEILRFEPKLWIFSTQLYENQGPEWAYLAPALGRHVFFYSEKALSVFAAKHGYQFLRGRHLHMLVKRTGNPYWQRLLLRHGAPLLIGGGKLAGATAGLHFLARQRRAYRYWQSDSEHVRRQTRPPGRT